MTPSMIAVVAFDRISPFHLSVPCAVFGDAAPDKGMFRLAVCAIEPGALMTSAGFAVVVEQGLEVLEQADMVIVPGWHDPAVLPAQALLDALVAAWQRGAVIVGLCLGAYVLAEAGLLDKRRATTHWAYAQDFARRYPSVVVEPDVLYVDEGRIVTSAGTAAGIDCCLHLLRERCGSRSANAVARRLVVAPHRQGGQAQFIEQPVVQRTEDARLAAVFDWVRSHLPQAHSVDSLAERAVMSRRTFTRKFRQHTGVSVSDWLLQERLAAARQLLEDSQSGIEQIAESVGFGSVVSLRQRFRQAFGVSPAAWRRSFRGQ